jgi:hypothetical protein
MGYRYNHILLAAAIGATLGVSASPTFAKTAEECNAEYAANQDVIKAAGGTKTAYLAACKAALVKTSEECNAEYAANQDVIRAAHGSKKAYLASCRAGLTSATAPPPAAAELPNTVSPSPEATPPTGLSSSARGRPRDGTIPIAEAPEVVTPTPAAPEAPANAAPPPAAPASVAEPPQESNVSVTASSGKPTEFDAYFTLNPDCSSMGYADTEIKTDVKNGKFYARSGRDRPTFPSDNKLHKCNKKLVPSTQLWYESNKGYVGEDKLSVELTLANREKVNVIYNITVK